MSTVSLKGHHVFFYDFHGLAKSAGYNWGGGGVLYVAK